MKSAKMKVIVLSLVGLLLITAIMGTVYARSESRNNHYDGFYQNQFSESRVDLWLKDQDDGWGDPVSKTWVVTNMAPGDEFAFDESFVGLRTKFPKKVDVGKVVISCNYTATEGPPIGDPDNVDTSANPDSFARYMEITYAQYMDDLWYYDLLTGEKYTRPDTQTSFSWAATDTKWQIEDQAYLAATDGIISLYDLKWDPLTNLPSPRGGKGTRFEMSVKFHEGAGNEFQGDTFNLTMIFTLEPE